jgi:hypothetical protein
VNAKNAHSSSFSDPSGYVFIIDGDIKRDINPIYFKRNKALTDSEFFNITEKVPISNSDRVMYLLQVKSNDS